MTNFQIIANAMIDSGLATKEMIAEIVKNKQELPLHTFADWKNRGYKIKKGEHAVMTAVIWKRKFKKKIIEDAPVDLVEEFKDEEVEDTGNFVRTKAFFFREDQVEKFKA